MKRRSAEGQSSCVPPGKNHMPWEKESRENTAAVGGCVCARVRIHMHTVCVFVCVGVCILYKGGPRRRTEDMCGCLGRP